MVLSVLNLYAGIGGNRKLWPKEVGGHKVVVTAVEKDPLIAKVYQDLFPDDIVIVGDAHEYLLLNYNAYDFIWSSPPCQTHSSFRQNICVEFRGTDPEYPDMKLYQEILMLLNNCKKLWVVENVVPYYEPLITPMKVLQRHTFWCNFFLHEIKIDSEKLRSAQIPDLETHHGVDLSGYKLPNKRQVLRNCVDSKLGKHVFDCAFKYRQQKLF